MLTTPPVKSIVDNCVEQYKTPTPTPALTPTWFHRLRGAVTNTWKGNASNVQVYNRELSAAEIQQNFNALKSRFSIN